MDFEETVQITDKNKDSDRLALQLLRDSDFSDVTLVSGDNHHVAAHRAVLAASSSFLRTLLLDSCQQSTFLYLGMVEGQVLEALVAFIYLGTATLPRRRLEHLLVLADQLGVAMGNIPGDHLVGKHEEWKTSMENIPDENLVDTEQTEDADCVDFIIPTPKIEKSDFTKMEENLNVTDEENQSSQIEENHFEDSLESNLSTPSLIQKEAEKELHESESFELQAVKSEPTTEINAIFASPKNTLQIKYFKKAKIQQILRLKKNI